MSDSPPGTARLVFWPAVLTLAISATRLLGEHQGWINNQSDGALALLGISWLMFVFGWWFARRLARGGSTPRVQRPWLLALVGLVSYLGVAGWQFSHLDLQGRSDADYAALRTAVTMLAATAGGAALLAFVVWPRLAWTLLCYGLVARLFVVAEAWLAKTNGWNTHYTKFGPAGIERPMGDTMASACLSQLGMWVPLTVAVGVFVGSLLVRSKDGDGR